MYVRVEKIAATRVSGVIKRKRGILLRVTAQGKARNEGCEGVSWLRRLVEGKKTRKNGVKDSKM